MGVYFDYGRYTRGKDLIDSSLHTWWLQLGRCDFGAGAGQSSWAWSDEHNPPAEDPAVGNPDKNEMNTSNPLIQDYNHVGLVKATQVAMVKPDVTGTIYFDSQYWKISTDLNAKHVYFRFVIEPSYFTAEDDLEPTIVAYRRLSLVADISGSAITGGAIKVRPSTIGTGGDLGYVLFYSNEISRTRASGERHVIEIILAQ